MEMRRASKIRIVNDSVLGPRIREGSKLVF